MSRTDRRADDALKQFRSEAGFGTLCGKRTVDFALVWRAGHETLNAGDNANNCIRISGSSFEFMLIAEEATDSSQHLARMSSQTVEPPDRGTAG